MKNYFLNPEDLSQNPIQVLRSNIKYELSKISPAFSEVIERITKEQKFHPDNLIFGDENYPASKGPKAGLSSVILYDAFQVYLWCICYCMYVYHVEMTLKRHRNVNEGKENLLDGVDFPKLRAAMSLMDYAMRLLQNFEPWDLNLPNPAYYQDDLDTIVTTVNGIYLKAMNFVIGHEIAHLELDHTTGEADPLLSELDMEIQADNRSIELINDGLTNFNEATVQIGLLAALCALLLTSSKLEAGGHPDADDRIGAFIEHIDIEDNNDLWALAVLAYRLWAVHHGHHIFFFQNLDSQRDVYFEIRKQLSGETVSEYIEIDTTKGKYGVATYVVGDRRQFWTKIDGYDVWFELNNETRSIIPIMNHQFAPDEEIAEMVTTLQQYMLDRLG